MNDLCFGFSTGLVWRFHHGVHHSACQARPLRSPPASLRLQRARVQMASDAPVPEQLASPDFLDRIRGINRIEELADTSARISALIPIATEDPNQQVRYAAISRISNLGHQDLSPEDEEKLLSAARFVLLNDKESSCQSGAADLIAGLKLNDGFDDLVDAFNRTTDWMLKFSIAAGLGEMGDPKAFGFLTSILDDNKDSQDFLLMAAAIGALGELGDKRGIAVVEKYLENDDASIRERANIAHGMLLGKE